MIHTYLRLHTFAVEEIIRIVAVLRHFFRRWSHDGHHFGEVMTIRALFIRISSIDQMSLLEEIPFLHPLLVKAERPLLIVIAYSSKGTNAYQPSDIPNVKFFVPWHSQ